MLVRYDIMITQFHLFLTNNEKLIKQFSVYNMQMTVRFHSKNIKIKEILEECPVPD